MSGIVRRHSRSQRRKILQTVLRLACVALALTSPLSTLAQPSANDTLAPGRRPVGPEFILRTGDAVAICLGDQPQWIDFCNGLVQGYAEYVILNNKACIPVATTRRELVAIFTAPEIVVNTGYIDDWPAFNTAVEIFIRYFPCD